MGLASHLQEFEANEINKAIFQQKWKLVERLKYQINWGPSLDSLPIYSWSEFEALCINYGGSRHLICISGVIYDVEQFIESHPGGKPLLAAHIGKDATASFHGGVYKRKCMVIRHTCLSEMSRDSPYFAPINPFLDRIANPRVLQILKLLATCWIKCVSELSAEGVKWKIQVNAKPVCIYTKW